MADFKALGKTIEEGGSEKEINNGASTSAMTENSNVKKDGKEG